MKKLSYFFVAAIMLCFAVSSFDFGNAKVFAEESFDVLAFGDSISAGYAPNVSPYCDTDETTDQTLLSKRQMLANYVDYYNSEYGTTVSASTYSYIFGKRLDASANIKSYANSGDTSTDLVSILTRDGYEKTLAETNQVVQISKADVQADIRNAKIITLCIGANDVLAPAIDKIMGESVDFTALMNGYEQSELDEFSQTIATNVQTFKSNYTNIILPALKNGAQIYVMTIYNPYQYTNYEFVNTFVGFHQILDIAINGLNQVNQTIKKSAGGKVIVVDVAKEFANIAESDYKNYVNVDLSQVSMATIFALMGGEVPYYFDPHLTPLGQRKVGELFEESYVEPSEESYAEPKQGVPAIAIVAIVAVTIFVGLVVGTTIYLIAEKVKYKAIKF